MPVLPPVSSPRAAFADLRAFLRQRSREQVIGLALAILVTIIIIIVFLVDSKINTAPPQTIIYVDDYKPGRTDAEIIAQQKKDQAEMAVARQEHQRQLQKVEKKLDNLGL